jgi:hypothetical protein
LWILSSHPEYWTRAQKQCLEDHLDSGGRLVYLAANGIYRRVEIDTQLQVVEFKTEGTFTLPGHSTEQAGEWENIAEKSKHPAKLTGGLIDFSVYCVGGAYKVLDPEHWAYKSLQDLLSKGMQFAGTVVPAENYGCLQLHNNIDINEIKPSNLVTPLGAAGWETDSIMEDSPEEYDLIGISTQDNEQNSAPLMYFRYGEGCVFSTNSMVSPWGLHNDRIFSAMVKDTIIEMSGGCPPVQKKAVQWGMWILLGCVLLLMVGGIVIIIRLIKKT